MFIIWSFGKITLRKFAARDNAVCVRCHNQVDRTLVRSTQWFCLFFIPVIPYGKAYYLECPICNRADMISKQEFEEYMRRYP